MGWFTNALRSPRYSMNLKLLEGHVGRLSSQQCAEVAVAAAALIVDTRNDDPALGMKLQFAALDPHRVSANEISTVYSALEDLMLAGESRRKALNKTMGTRLGPDAARTTNDSLLTQQLGIQLLLVVLARQLDHTFRAKTANVGNRFSDAMNGVPQAVEDLKRRDQLAQSLAASGRERIDFDYAEIGGAAELIVNQLQ